MQKSKKNNDASELLNCIIKGIKEKKGHEIKSIDLKELDNSICDYFVVCHGDSAKQVEAISDSVEEIVKKEHAEMPWHMEGHENCEWVLMDYVNIVVHIFRYDKREFYAIEELWGDAKIELV